MILEVNAQAIVLETVSHMKSYALARKIVTAAKRKKCVAQKLKTKQDYIAPTILLLMIAQKNVMKQQER